MATAAISGLRPAEQTQLVPFPPDTRGLFRAFRYYDCIVGLASVLNRLDLSNIRPRHIYYSVLSRLPETAQVTLPKPAYSPHDHLYAALNSEEFQHNIISLILRAFPERRRLVFIHIPKCAGTHLHRRLSARYPHLSDQFQQRALMSPAELFSAIHRIVMEPSTRQLFVSLHLPLSWYLQRSLLRMTDELFTVVRDPFDLVISSVNYIAGKLTSHPTFAPPDTKVWAAHLGIVNNPAGPWLKDKLALCRQILINSTLTPKNMLCRYLGLGSASSAIDMIIRTNIEITDVTRYDRWFAEKWELPLGPRENVSEPILARSALSNEEVNYIDEITQEDRIIYNRVIGTLNKSPNSSILGETLGL